RLHYGSGLAGLAGLRPLSDHLPLRQRVFRRGDGVLYPATLGQPLHGAQGAEQFFGGARHAGGKPLRRHPLIPGDHWPGVLADPQAGHRGRRYRFRLCLHGERDRYSRALPAGHRPQHRRHPPYRPRRYRVISGRREGALRAQRSGGHGMSEPAVGALAAAPGRTIGEGFSLQKLLTRPWLPLLPFLALPLLGGTSRGVDMVILSSEVLFLLMALQRPVWLIGAIALSEMTTRNY